jgi:hypothetical protein
MCASKIGRTVGVGEGVGDADAVGVGDGEATASVGVAVGVGEPTAGRAHALSNTIATSTKRTITL